VCLIVDGAGWTRALHRKMRDVKVQVGQSLRRVGRYEIVSISHLAVICFFTMTGFLQVFPFYVAFLSFLKLPKLSFQ